LNLDTLQLAYTLVIGAMAGLLGGLAGVGGSMVILPSLHLVFGDEPASIHHLYMGAAMTVNVAVSIPAALRHHRLRAVRIDLMRTLLPVTTAAIIAGVLLSNRLPGDALKLMLAGFLAIYCALNLVRLLRNSPEHAPEHERSGKGRLMLCGVATGLIAGLLGLGGGVLLVPMLQMLCRVPLRNAIATSSAVICMTSIVGAGSKLASLPGLGQSASQALMLAALMAPTAMLGGWIGAHLTHALPIRLVRAVITVLLILAAAKLAGLW
jgi:uncharacterized membrane protein YfcA